ncbi:hypothetical protein LXT12_16545 [Pelomonas sp. P7]|uniref:UrcA family protein n=1 Tax=Pelomonas caseinilytica TaxID=2906763 RepID=A0ABS8XD69_9BURK|nr:hypothetical protein [Pelomonas sp. P7]MCE4538864.1 hypothetical protein [Pelomonas sp. P7]
MNTLARTLIVATLVAAHGVAGAGPRYYGPPPYHHHHHHHGAGLGGLVLGLAVAVPLVALASRADPAPEVVYVPPPAPLPPPAPVRPAPVIYPRNGQSDVQREADLRECNRWATTQPAAMADAGVFQRAIEACMDGRGYTLR